jgi:hypothetical protein
MAHFGNRWLARFALLAVLTAGLTAFPICAQVTDDVKLLPTRERSFSIPFNVTSGDNRLREVQLFVSRDLGQTWTYSATSAPDKGNFTQFTATQDGQYWFSVRTIDQQGRAYPPSDREFKPGLKVLVDTVPPVVNFRQVPAQGANLAVEWDVSDDNLDLKSLRLEYHAASGGAWVPVRIDQPATRGQQTFSPMTNGALDVRLTVQDSAGNIGEGKVTATPGVAPAAGPANLPGPSDAGTHPAPPGPPVRFVNTTKISLNYRIDDVGPSGVSAVELWYTHDGRNWQRYPVDQKDVGPPLIVNVQGPGMYGFSLVVRSGVGVGDKPPQYGEQPQVWVEVDTTPPVVQLLNVDVGREADAGNLTITWTASDKNFGPQPITLSYAETPTGPWHMIADKIENRGKFVWKMPAPGPPPTGVPFKFLVKVEATDKAGNVGSAMTRENVLVDLARPRAAILEIGSAPK